ncbi:MAG: CRISPR-associated endonuclease Cas2 [Candidatus Aenigmatarchaeota archaeon]
MKKNFIIIFDIPNSKKSLARKIQRELNTIGACMLQKSVWKSSNLGGLKKLAQSIKKNDGNAFILEEKVIL